MLRRDSGRRICGVELTSICEPKGEPPLLLCLPDGERIADDIDRRHQQPSDTCVPAQREANGRLHKALQPDEARSLRRTDDIPVAIKRETESKGWARVKKVALIEKANPKWEDLAAAWNEK